MEYLHSILASGIFLGTPLLLAALGEMIMEKAGIINIALEGKMLVAAFCAFSITYFSGSLLLGFIAAITGALFVGFLFAGFCVSAQADQIIVGAGINLLALGITGILLRWIIGQTTSVALTVPTFQPITIPVIASIPVIGPLFFNQNILVYITFLLVPITWLLLNRTRLGLNWRAVGENPSAADAAGIDVQKLRFRAILTGSIYCGLAGAFLSTTQANTFIENMTAGRGFIALAIVIFARWQPFAAFGVALLFGLASTVQFHFQAMVLNIPYQFFLMLPYLLTIITAAIFGGRTKAPAALAKPYFREG